MADSYGIHAQAAPATSNESTLLTAATNASYIVTLAMANFGSSEVSVSVGVSTSGAAVSSSGWLLSGEPLAAGRSMQLSGICLDAFRSLRIKATPGASTSFVITGLKMT